MENKKTNNIRVEMTNNGTPPKVTVEGKDLSIVSLKYEFETADDFNKPKNKLYILGYLDGEEEHRTFTYVEGEDDLF